MSENGASTFLDSVNRSIRHAIDCLDLPEGLAETIIGCRSVYKLGRRPLRRRPNGRWLRRRDACKSNNRDPGQPLD